MKIVMVDGLPNYTFEFGASLKEKKGVDPATSSEAELKALRENMFFRAYGTKLEEKEGPKKEKEKDRGLAERIEAVESLLGTEGITSPRLAEMKKKQASGISLREADLVDLAEIEGKAPELVSDVHRVKESVASRK